MNLRIGRVSSIEDNGMVKVVFEDQDSYVSEGLPLLTFNDEYKMPQINDLVLVASINKSSSIVLGTFYSDEKIPTESCVKNYRKDFAANQNEAFMSYDSGKKELTIVADHIRFITNENSVNY